MLLSQLGNLYACSLAVRAATQPSAVGVETTTTPHPRREVRDSYHQLITMKGTESLEIFLSKICRKTGNYLAKNRSPWGVNEGTQWGSCKAQNKSERAQRYLLAP